MQVWLDTARHGTGAGAGLGGFLVITIARSIWRGTPAGKRAAEKKRQADANRRAYAAWRAAQKRAR